MGFAAVFAYQVDPAQASAFEVVYGPDGDWARFSRGGEGYERTEPLRSPTRYLVIDRWRSAAAYDTFVRTHADEHRRRSEAAAALYRSGEFLGRFDGT